MNSKCELEYKRSGIMYQSFWNGPDKSIDTKLIALHKDRNGLTASNYNYDKKYGIGDRFNYKGDIWEVTKIGDTSLPGYVFY